MAIRLFMTFKTAIALASLVLLLLPLTPASAFDPPPPEVPMHPVPVHRASLLTSTEAAIRSIMAESLHEAQLRLLDGENLVDNSTSRGAFVLGVTFALEEYFQLELSFPQNVSDLVASSYLYPGWEEAGFHIICFTPGDPPPTGQYLVYAPQPLGRTKLICPDRNNPAWKMRRYSEYALVVNSMELSAWGIENAETLTKWCKSYNELGMKEVIYVNKDDPAKSHCWACEL